MMQAEPDVRDEERWVGTPPRGWGKATRTGLVLSGGGLRFAVHAGLYDRLEKLPYCEADGTAGPALADLFDCLVGTSAGSLLASAIACGFCAEDVWRFSTIFSRPSFQSDVLDPNWLGIGSFLLKGDPGYVKGLYRGEAIQRTLSVFFSHNFLSGLGGLYQSFAERGQALDGAAFETEIVKLLRSLERLPLERLPQMSATGSDHQQPAPTTQANTLRLITFQDLNPAVRVPYEHYRHDGQANWREQALNEAHQRLTVQQAHAEGFQTALADYYRGRRQAGRYVCAEPTAPRPMLMLIGTDLVTGQKTVFSNYNLFEKELVYSKTQSQSSPANGVSYRYIDKGGRFSGLPPDLSEELRPVNYLYKYLYNGLPVVWGVRASLSIPGVFAPAVIPYQDNFGIARTDFFLDGGVTDNYALQVAADWNLGRCQHILGGNIGNLGPRVHDYGVRSVLEILVKTLYIQGDTNVDANADDRLLQNSAVTTIDELTVTDVGGIRDLVKIPRLLVEGGQLADQFFATFRQPDRAGNPVGLAALFGEVGDYTVFLPRIETYGLPPGSPAPPISAVPVGCTQIPTGSSEIDRIELKIEMDEPSRTAVKQTRSVQLGKCEANLTPSPLRSPGGWLFGLFGGDGPSTQPVPTSDLINLVRLAVLAVVLGFVSLLNLGLWRLSLLLWQSAGLFGTIAREFDGWGYWLLLITVILTGLSHYYIFLRLFIFDFWVARPAKLLRRGIEILPGLGLYWLPLYLAEGVINSWAVWLIPLLVALSSGALLFTLYALVSFVVSLIKTFGGRKAGA